MNLFQKLKVGANKATDYAQQTMKTSKINTQIAGIKREIERNNTQIGHAVYEAYKANDLTMAEEVVRLFSDNNLALEVEIAELEHEIEVIKNEKMCECGRKVTIDARFCPNCGKRFPFEPEVESAPEEEVVEVYRECNNCGTELAPDAKFCERCGVIVK
jgi:RNA polymerase subunit RPABC4/transcription elongation factor Spt4